MDLKALEAKWRQEADGHEILYEANVQRHNGLIIPYAREQRTAANDLRSKADELASTLSAVDCATCRHMETQRDITDEAYSYCRKFKMVLTDEFPGCLAHQPPSHP